MDIAYKEAIERIEVQPAEHQELAKKVLSWITYAKRPLSIIELRHALAVEINESKLDEENLPETEEMVSVCAGLVIVDEESSVIRLVHYTTQEFFERFRLSWTPNGQSDVAMICLTYLLFDVFAAGFCSSDKTFEAMLRNNVFLNYAARYWGLHVRESSNEAVTQLAVNFLGDESKISCSSQVLMVSGDWYYGYSQSVVTKMSAVHLAAYFGLREIVTALLTVGHLSYVKASDGRTPLSLAAWNGHEAVVKLLVERDDVEADSKDDGGWTPLSLAAWNGHEAVVKLLVERDDVEADSKDNDGRTPLYQADRNGHEAVVKLLNRLL